MRQLLRIRNARVFLFGWSVSVFGDWAIFIALGLVAASGADDSKASFSNWGYLVDVAAPGGGPDADGDRR